METVIKNISPGIIREKTIVQKLMYIRNKDIQCIPSVDYNEWTLNLLNQLIKVSKVVKPRIRKRYY